MLEISERLLAGLRTLHDEEARGNGTVHDSINVIVNPDDSGPRLSISLQESSAIPLSELPSAPPLPSEMPAAWWEPLLLGKPDNAVSPQDARLALALIDARLGEYQDSGLFFKRDPGANVRVGGDLPTTVGALHDGVGPTKVRKVPQDSC